MQPTTTTLTRWSTVETGTLDAVEHPVVDLSTVQLPAEKGKGLEVAVMMLVQHPTYGDV